jgi:hypothetical protein
MVLAGMIAFTTNSDSAGMEHCACADEAPMAAMPAKTNAIRETKETDMYPPNLELKNAIGAEPPERTP